MHVSDRITGERDIAFIEMSTKDARLAKRQLRLSHLAISRFLGKWVYPYQDRPSQWLWSGAFEEAPLLEWKICLLLLLLPDISCLHLRSGSTLLGSAELE